MGVELLKVDLLGILNKEAWAEFKLSSPPYQFDSRDQSGY
jgi:hypothetical protein